MDDLVAAAEVRVLVRERVEAVRAARDDLRHAGLVRASRRSAPRAPGRRTRCPSAAPGRRCTSRAGRGSRSRRRPRAAASPSTRPRSARARRTTRRSRPSRAPPAPGLPARARARRAPPPSRHARPGACPRGSTPRSTSRSIGPASAGKRDSTITRCRRRSTMWSTCSIDDRALVHAGAACDAVPDHLVRDRVGDERRGSPPRRAARGPSAQTWSRTPMISSFGESALPVAYAGQTSWQRPHSVQRTCRRSASRSGRRRCPAEAEVLLRARVEAQRLEPPARAVRPKKTLIAAVTMCRCFE